MDIMIEQYDKYLSDLSDKYAPHAVKNVISKRKSELMEQRVINSEGIQKNCFLSYIIYLVVNRIQCCQNISALIKCIIIIITLVSTINK